MYFLFLQPIRTSFDLINPCVLSLTLSDTGIVIKFFLFVPLSLVYPCLLLCFWLWLAAAAPCSTWEPIPPWRARSVCRTARVCSVCPTAGVGLSSRWCFLAPVLPFWLREVFLSLESRKISFVFFYMHSTFGAELLLN